jgi:mannose-6-phosphate isomerase-like protein (cupin superfamily)
MSDAEPLNENETDRWDGAGENKKVVWEVWQKKRTFVRALENTYGEVYKNLFTQPRVYSSTDWKWKGGPTLYHKGIINPGSVQIAQSIECHIDVYAPGCYGQKHGHMNSAVFYVLKGKGHDEHDGRKLPWSAGDSCIVENGCVHQHFNDDLENDAMVLIMKAKPLFLFMHMIFQKMVEYPPTVPPPGAAAYQPPTHICHGRVAAS